MTDSAIQATASATTTASATAEESVTARVARTAARAGYLQLVAAAMRELDDTTIPSVRRACALRVALREAASQEDHDMVQWLHARAAAVLDAEHHWHECVAPRLDQCFAVPARMAELLAITPRASVLVHTNALLLRAVLSEPIHVELLDLMVMQYGADVTHNDYDALRAAIGRDSAVGVRALVRLLGWDADRVSEDVLRRVQHQRALFRGLNAALNDSNIIMARELAVFLRRAVAAPAPAPVPVPAAAHAMADDNDDDDDDDEIEELEEAAAEAVLTKSANLRNVTKHLRAYYTADPNNGVSVWRVHMRVSRMLKEHGLPDNDTACEAAMRDALAIEIEAGSKPDTAVYHVRVRPPKRVRGD